jgi:hypothetical protein
METGDERDIYYYLYKWPRSFVSPVEICRRAAGRRRYREDPDWARPVLIDMARKGILEADPSGHYRIRISYRPARKRWLSPRFAAIAKAHPDTFKEKVYPVDEDDEANPGGGV